MKDIILMQIIPVSVFIAVFAGVFATISGASIDPAAAVVSFAVAAIFHFAAFAIISDQRIKQELNNL